MSTPMVNLTIDGRAVSVPKGTLVIAAAQAAGIEIPHFCHHPKLDPVGVCRMCIVVQEGQRKPITSCTTPVAEGMVIHTANDTARGLQKGVLEFLLINHPLDCPVCDKGGECPLQDQTFKFGPSTSRLADAKVRKNKAQELGPFIVLDEERCVLCRRCTRFDDEIAAEGNLIIAERGHENVVTTGEGRPFDSYFSGNTIELCPVGALTSDLYRFKARPWDLSRVEAVCTGCAVGCNVELHFRHGRLLRVWSRDNPQTDGGWLCDRGRFGYGHVHSPQRVTQPLVRKNGELVDAAWEEALQAVARGLKAAGKDAGFLGGGRLTLEEAYLFQKLARQVVGSEHIDHRAGAQRVVSLNKFPGRQADLNDADTILIVDCLVAERAPVLDLRVRRALERRRARVIAVGAALPGYRRPIQAVQTLDSAAALRGLDLSAAQKVVAIWGGEDEGTGAALLEVLQGLEKAGKRVHLLIPGEQANSRGAEWAGCVPKKGMDGGEMLTSGKLKALYVAGANPALTHPQGAGVSQVPFLVVQDLFLTATAREADVVLPAAPFAAKSGHFVALDGLVQAIGRAAMAPGGQAKPDGEIFQLVAYALGGSVATDFRQVLPQVGEVLPGAAVPLAAAARSLPAGEGLALVPVDRLFAGGGTAANDPGLDEVRVAPTCWLHPADAQALGVADGDPVSLGGRHAAARLSPAVLRGTVQVPRGVPDLPVYQLPRRVQVEKRVREEVAD